MTPTNDNTTAGDPKAWRVRVQSDDTEEWSLLPAGGGADYLDRKGLECQPLYGSDAITALQARVAEVEAERDAAIDAGNLVMRHLQAALSREKEAKAEGIRAAYDAVVAMEWTGDGDDVCDMLRALAQSGGADPAQGKGDIATTALAYLVNAQHDLRTGNDPVRAAATISDGVAAVEAMRAGGGA